MAPLFPILLVGGTFVVLSSKKKKKTKKAIPSNQKALPPAALGETFHEMDLPDVIALKKGSRFSIILSAKWSSDYRWKLSASPPDNSIKLISSDMRNENPGLENSIVEQIFVFESAKSGDGSIVFHLQSPHMDGKEPPIKIVEIETKIS